MPFESAETSQPGVAQLVARVVWDHEVAGSIPVTSTIFCNIGSPTLNRDIQQEHFGISKMFLFFISIILSLPNYLLKSFQ